MIPPISATVQYFREAGCEPVAALVVGRGKHRTVNLALFPDKHWPLEKWMGNHRRDVPFVPQGTDPPPDSEYCAFPAEPVIMTPGNVTISVT